MMRFYLLETVEKNQQKRGRELLFPPSLEELFYCAMYIT